MKTNEKGIPNFLKKKKKHGRCPDEFFSLTIQIIFSKLTKLSRSVLSFSKCFKQNVTKKK